MYRFIYFFESIIQKYERKTADIVTKIFQATFDNYLKSWSMCRDLW